MREHMAKWACSFHVGPKFFITPKGLIFPKKFLNNVHVPTSYSWEADAEVSYAYSTTWYIVWGGLFFPAWLRICLSICSSSGSECHQAVINRYTKQEIRQWTTSWACPVSWVIKYFKRDRFGWYGSARPVEASEAARRSSQQSSSGLLPTIVVSSFPGIVPTCTRTCPRPLERRPDTCTHCFTYRISSIRNRGY